MIQKHKSYFWLVVIIIAVAAFFRLYRLDTTPPGLYPDEAMNGNNAIQALETGNFKVFYTENNGREGLFINLQALSILLIGNKVIALRVVSAIVGILTVLGLYFLTKVLFNREIALIASFLMAVSFWHVHFSRMGFRAIMAPFFLVWMLYFFWRGISSTRFFYFVLSGIAMGLGFYTYIAFRAIPLALIIVLLAYWHFLQKDIKPDGAPRYGFLKFRLEQGLAAFILAMVIVSLPLGIYFYSHQEDFLGRTAQVSIFTAEHPPIQFFVNLGKTLASFNFIGDGNWRHSLAGAPLLIWMVGIFFVLGFIKAWIKLFKRKKDHGHISVVQTMLIAVFLIGLLPTFVSNEGIPHALRSLIVAPIVFIFAAEGMWWFFETLKDWYSLRDAHRHEAIFVSTLVIITLLVAIAVVEFDKYFNKWAKNPIVPSYYNQNYVDIGKTLNSLPQETPKYVVVYAGGVEVATPDNPTKKIAMPTQTVMFITDTWTEEKQKAKNIFYISPEDFEKGKYNKRGIVVPLK